MPDPMHRTHWSEGWSNQRDHYGEVIGFTLHASAEAHAGFIGSLTEDGFHAPLFDLDLQAVACPDGSVPGRTRLCLDRAVPNDLLQAVWGRLHQTGLGPAPADIIPGEGAVLVFTVPIRLIPSRTRGHFHLYVDAKLAWAAYGELLADFAWAGIIEARFRDMCFRQRMGFLRVPGSG